MHEQSATSALPEVNLSLRNVTWTVDVPGESHAGRRLCVLARLVGAPRRVTHCSKLRLSWRPGLRVHLPPLSLTHTHTLSPATTPLQSPSITSSACPASLCVPFRPWFSVGLYHSPAVCLSVGGVAGARAGPRRPQEANPAAAHSARHQPGLEARHHDAGVGACSGVGPGRPSTSCACVLTVVVVM